MDGFIDSLRVSKTARYTSNFTPHTTAFKDDKDTVLLLHMDGGGGIDPETNLPTLPGQGTYFWDASTNAIFYDSDGNPTDKFSVSEKMLLLSFGKMIKKNLNFAEKYKIKYPLATDDEKVCEKLGIWVEKSIDLEVISESR